MFSIKERKTQNVAAVAATDLEYRALHAAVLHRTKSEAATCLFADEARPTQAVALGKMSFKSI